ncbi:family 16 glycosylhydrolase [Saccharicrinis sp. FJH62]|uniref:family 16 glycosylhydrolase n=1 Tax=Saccharicrinis sp. FJH62 TaxID=3344657 RepID=UPI0035D42BA3
MGLFGNKFPDTEKIEKQDAEHKRLYQEVLATANSEDLKEYLELKDEVSSPEFVNEKHRVTGLKWKSTKEYSRLKEFNKLTKNKDLKAYFELKDSDELKSYLEFRKTDAYRDITDKKKRKASADLERYFKFENSKVYKSFKKIEGSGTLNQYLKLKEEVESDKFKEYKAFCEDVHRWNHTEQAKKEQRFHNLDQDVNIKNYVKFHNSDLFDLFKFYDITFAEDFAPEKLDTHKWKTQFHLGSEFGQGNYSLENHLQAYSNGRNIEISRDYMTIDTRAENTTARVWDKERGFFQREMNYTSGVISTGKSFKQNEGIFKIKLKTDSHAPVSHSVQLVSPKGNIQIKLLQISQKGKPMVGLSTYDGKRHTVRTSRIKGLNTNAGFHIFSVEWQKEMLIWKVNDKEVFRTEIKLPKEEMILELASMVYKTKKKPAPGKLIVDWIKVYKKTA